MRCSVPSLNTQEATPVPDSARQMAVETTERLLDHVQAASDGVLTHSECIACLGRVALFGR